MRYEHVLVPEEAHARDHSPCQCPCQARPAHNAGVLVKPKDPFELLNSSAKVGTPAILLQEYQLAYSGRQAAARC